MLARKKNKKLVKTVIEKPLNLLDKVSWIDTPRNYFLEPSRAYGGYDANGTPIPGGFTKSLKLSEYFESVATPAGFNITLLAHQGVVVKAMLDLEQKRYIKVTGIGAGFTARGINGIDEAHIETCAGVLSDKLGSGKTYDILGLIAHSKTLGMPRVANITHLPLPSRDKTIRGYHFRGRDGYQHVGYKTEVRRIYKKFIPLSLIFVSKSVLIQWQRAITENTNLKVFMIENIFHLKAFYAAIFKPTKTNNLEKLLKDGYDIILIKNGNVSGAFNPDELHETSMDGVGVKKILSVFGELFKDFCFTRVVLDDFDTLGIPNNAFTIPAIMTWFVSATKKNTASNTKEYAAKNVQDAIVNYRPAYTSVWKNRDLFTFFNISCEDEFVDTSTKAGPVEFYIYKFHNANEQYIGLLGAMGTEDAHMVMEALNGDAINAAATNAGIKSTSVADIFEKVLDDKWVIYKKNLEVEKYLERVSSYFSELRGPSQDDEGLGQTALGKLRKNLKHPGPMEQLKSTVKYRDESAKGVVDEVRGENSSSKDANGKAIARVKDNLKQGDCPITCVPLKECNGVVIMKCCGITISAEAASWSLKFHKASAAQGDIAGACPGCRRIINFNQLILVDQDMNFDNIINESGVVEPIEESIVSVQDEVVETVDEPEVLDKYSCIVRIIQGKDQSEDITALRTKRDVHIAGMLVGPNVRGIAPGEQRKVLVYASYGETLDLLTEKLIAKGISYLRLQGTTRQIDDMVERYKLPNDNPESISVLLINGPTYCAGLNLENTTDLIYAHKVIERNIESQVAGRAARFGREYDLRIHYVLYDNEISHMFPGHQ